VISRFAHRWLRGLSVCWSAILLWAVAMSSAAQLVVVLSDESASYQEVVGELRARVAPVREGRIRINAVTAQHVASGDATVFAGTELVVTVGLSAAQATIAHEAMLAAPPLTLCLLIPRQSYERLRPSPTSGRERRLSAVFIDQPLSRQLDLIRIALPDKVRVGVILGPSSELLKDEFREKARERALVPKFAEVVEASGVYGALQKVLPESDLLLALPDPVAVNAATAYGLLLTSYRAQVPVIGFSEGMAKAGALLALFSTPSQQGKQGAEIVSRMLAGALDLPAPQYPKYFTVRVNFSVARSLGLRIEEEATLAAALAARGDGVGESIPRRSASDTPTFGRTP
jgi:putative ABC transport system substrate-binding protein